MVTRAAKPDFSPSSRCAPEQEERRAMFRISLAIIGAWLLNDLLRQRDGRRKRMLEDLAAEGDEAAAQEWWETHGGGCNRENAEVI